MTVTFITDFGQLPLQLFDRFHSNEAYGPYPRIERERIDNAYGKLTLTFQDDEDYFKLNVWLQHASSIGLIEQVRISR